MEDQAERRMHPGVEQMPVDCQPEVAPVVKLEAQGERHPSMELQGTREV